ncbi:hypothetical protein EJ05DRAFT_513143 [Pseudovirgaria hyperparasitica]|uniref:Uncharacterized protein n=1 Tax=Pseudovirgaria hyperparasitica TaxID=470096 RepID=A0A6A6W152_9PEZI|nr:uncharacterized protein EJ05DRAFT_513143 [Pseudovirgaria hyperparasitica]KAF2755660.1 hypothetical protein EJ05DRAFT_513143 [Pseudovirgaria hyperparasitica]
MPVSESSARLSTGFTGKGGLQPWSVREPYTAYKSPYGPQYKAVKQFHGISFGRAARFGITAAGFGGVAGFAALFMFAELPRVAKDIMQPIPILGSFFTKEIAPEDNPF